METRDYAAIAKQYARDVVSGKQPAGKSIRLQCERFLHELTRHRRKDFPYTFDPKKAAKVCAFVECLPHTKGKWASQRARLVLEPWQIWILALTFGWLHKGTKLRRFRRLLLVVPRKNGKSALAAGIGLYMLCLDGEAGAEVYSGATTEKQAKEVFTPARLMALRTPQLTSAFGIEVLAKALIKPADASKFEMITGDPGDGQSPSCAITDEYHEHDDDRQGDTMLTGMGARDQPLQVIVTTAGYKLDGPCYAEILECRERLAGIGHNGGPPLDDDMLFVEYAADEEDDWRSENTLRKANPNYGVSVGEEYLQSRLRDAIRSPRKAAIYKTKHLNLWVAAKAAWFDVEHWRKCTRDTIAQRSSEALTDADLQGRRCIIAGDLATKIDIAALEYLFLPIGGKPTPDDPYIRIGRYFLPSDRIEDVPAYQGWDSADLLDVTEGNVTDFEEIEDALRDAASRFDIEAVAMDPWQAAQMIQRMQSEGLPMVEYRMTVQNFSAPMKELDALMREQQIVHGGCPVMEWQINNVTGQLDKKDNVFPNKPRAEAKIDNPVALMMAIGVAMAGEEEEMQTSPWDDPEYSLNGADVA